MIDLRELNFLDSCGLSRLLAARRRARRAGHRLVLVRGSAGRPAAAPGGRARRRVRAGDRPAPPRARVGQLRAGRQTTPAEAQVATASGRSSSGDAARGPGGRGRRRWCPPRRRRPRARGSRGRCGTAPPTGRRSAASSAWRVPPSPAGERLQLARLLERVHAHLGVAAEREPHAGVAVGRARREAVAEAALGRRAGDDDGVALGQQGDVLRRDVDAVDHARARPEEARAVEQRGGGEAVLGAALLHLARLLVRVDVADEAVGVGVGGDRLEPARGHGAHAVGGDADGHARATLRPARAGRPRARGTSPRRGRRSAAGPAWAGGRRRPSPRGGRRRAGARRAARRRARPPRPRWPWRWDPRRACRRAGGGRSGTRPPRRSRPRPSRRRRAPRATRIEAGSCVPASRYIASRQDQKSSAACASGAGRSAAPRRSRWNACECALTMAGISYGLTRAPPARAAARPRRAAASSSATSSSGAWLIPVALRTSTMPAGRRSATIPASWPGEARHARAAAPNAARTAGSKATPARVGGGGERDLDARGLLQRGGALVQRRAPGEQAVGVGRAAVDPQPHVGGNGGERVRARRACARR